MGGAQAVTFELVDRRGRLAGVRLAQEIGLPEPLEFARSLGRWRLTVELPDVQRMEYLLEVRDHNDNRMTVTDPTNPLRAPGAFGDKSVLELDGYAPPGWLAATPVESTETPLQLDAPELDGTVEITVWAPAGLDGPAPLLLVHDGPEYAGLAAFTQYLGAGIAAGELPPLRAALLDPGDRNAWYSANPSYAQVVRERVLPALEEAASPTTRIGVGASLGGLAMLHVHCHVPGLLGGLFLQSASFFTPALDPQESEFSGFAAVTEFVADLPESAPVPTVLTCGTVEENLANNEAMAATLRGLGYPVEMVTVADAHNFTAWRDALHPHLTGLVAEVVRRAS